MTLGDSPFTSKPHMKRYNYCDIGYSMNPPSGSLILPIKDPILLCTKDQRFALDRQSCKLTDGFELVSSSLKKVENR